MTLVILAFRRFENKKRSKRKYLDEKIKEMKKYIYQIKMVEGNVNEKKWALMR